MPFTAESYFVTVTGITGQGGTDVDRLADTSGGALDEGAATDHGTSGTKTLHFNPAGPTSVTSETIAFKGNGWAIARADMGSIATAKRIIPAGAWEFRLVAKASTAQVTADTTFTVVVYRVSAANAYSELFRATGAKAVGAAYAEHVVTSTSQGQITLDANETVHVEVWATAPGVAVTGQVLTLASGNTGGLTPLQTIVRVPSPGIRMLRFQTVDISGRGSAAQVKLPDKKVAVTGQGTPTLAKVVGKVVSVSGRGTAALQKLIPKLVSVNGRGIPGVRLEVPEAALDRIVVGGPADCAGTDPTRTIAGVVRNGAGVPVAGAVVHLIRESDHYRAGETTSAADGGYSFVRDAADPNTYYVVGHVPTDETLHGTSRRDLVPA